MRDNLDWLPDDYRPTRSERAAGRPLVDRLTRPLARVLHAKPAGGVALLLCAAVALAVANSPWAGRYAEFWQTRIGFTVGGFGMVKPLLLWIADGLMTIFFFLVGLEIKRELAFGELRDPRKVALPAAAALGGMAVPAGIYLAFQWGRPGESGWGVPMATDIAFVVGSLSLLGPRVPLGLKILLLTLAILDDIGAVLVIAFAYTAELAPAYLVPAAAGFGLMALCNWAGVRAVPVYVALGAAIWLAFLKSGVHPTVAGVLLGLLTPAYPWLSAGSLAAVSEGVGRRLRHGLDAEGGMGRHREAVRLLSHTSRESLSPLDRLESALHPWVAFVIMPLFALANAGVPIDLSELRSPVAVSVAAGLAVGKPLGVVAFSWVAVRLGLGRLPSGVGWGAMLGAGCLAGIGFTMSLFLAGLALGPDLLNAGKVGTLAGSAVSGLLGLGLLLYFLPAAIPPAKPEAARAARDHEVAGV